MVARIVAPTPPGGRMSGPELREALTALGTSQKAMAGFLGVPYRTFTDWLSYGPPQPVAILLRVMIHAKISMAEITLLLEPSAVA